jgi:hypothetical protein
MIFGLLHGWWASRCACKSGYRSVRVFKEELPLLAGPELTLMPEHRDHRPDHLRTRGQPRPHSGPSQLHGRLTGLRRRRHLRLMRRPRWHDLDRRHP